MWLPVQSAGEGGEEGHKEGGKEVQGEGDVGEGRRFGEKVKTERVREREREERKKGDVESR